MRKKYAAIFALVFVAGAVTAASAQETGQVGLNLGYPSLGITWHLTEKVAVRPEFTFSFGSLGSTSGSGVEGSDQDSWGVGFGASALFYFGEWDTVRTYFAPRLSLNFSNSDVVSTTSGSAYENSTRGWDLGVMVGAQYPLNPRFSVFGEAGFSYSDRHTEIDRLSSLEGKTDSWMLGPRTAIGMIFYF